MFLSAYWRIWILDRLRWLLSRYRLKKIDLCFCAWLRFRRDRAERRLFRRLEIRCGIFRPEIRNCGKLTSYIGSCLEFHWFIRSLLLSTTVTLISGQRDAITLHVGPPTYPAPIQHIFLITILSRFFPPSKIYYLKNTKWKTTMYVPRYRALVWWKYGTNSLSGRTPELIKYYSLIRIGRSWLYSRT